MRLFKEISKNLLGGVTPCGRCMFFTGGGGYFQGVKRFDGFSSKTITLFFSGGALKITGENFFLGKFQGGDLELLGKISCLEYAASFPLTNGTLTPANGAAAEENANARGGVEP